MIKVTRLNGKNFMLNAEIIETLEETPDTVITLVDGKKYVVKESIKELVKEVVYYKRQWFCMDRFEKFEHWGEEVK